jgi:thiol:disulfide interchange protein DsbA
MKMVTKWLLALVLPCVIATAALVEVAAADYQEGKEYLVLATPQPTSAGDKIEVVELFWYGCPHCYRLEPLMAEWLASKPDDVEFVRMPAVLGPNWELFGKAYYTAELLGVNDKVHIALFDALHKDRKKFRDEAALQAFFLEQGVSAEDFKNTFNSFAVNVKLNHAKQMTKRYAITGVPTIIINGKYSTSASQAGNNEKAIKVMDYLIVQERPQAAVAAGTDTH